MGAASCTQPVAVRAGVLQEGCLKLGGQESGQLRLFGLGDAGLLLSPVGI